MQNWLSQPGHSHAAKGVWFGRTAQLATLLVAAVLVGGGGASFGFSNLVVQIVALGLLAINYSAVEEFVRNGPRPLIWLVALSIALPLLQCIPLPPAIWQALPGRELVLQSLTLLGVEDHWFPITVDRHRTLLAAFSLVVPVATLVLAHGLGERRRAVILRVIVGLGLFALAIGAVQLASAGKLAMFYPSSDKGILFGTFANRNSTALFLVICLVCHFALAANPGNSVSRILHVLVAALFAIGVIATQSRSGTALLAMAIAARLAVMLIGSGKGGLGGLGGLRGNARIAARAGSILALLGAVAIAVAIGLGGTTLDKTFARFSNIEDARALIWEDSLVSAERFWPVGSGMATFDEVFQIDESLEYLDDRRAGRAHNDYLEIAIEAGLAGIAIVLCWLGWLVSRGWRAFRTGQGATVAAAGVSIVAILAQSVTDYPLRNEALLCVAALMVSLIAKFPRLQEDGGNATDRVSRKLRDREKRD